jgi:hypothetical protein
MSPRIHYPESIPFLTHFVSQCSTKFYHASNLSEKNLRKKSSAIFSNLTLNTFMNKQHVRPHLEFVIQTWCPWTQRDIKLLEAVQRRADRWFEGNIRGEVATSEPHNIRRLEEKRGRHEVFKVLKGFTKMDPETWSDYATLQQGQQTRHLTSHLTLNFHKGRLEIRRECFSVQANKVWNALPNHDNT